MSFYLIVNKAAKSGHTSEIWDDMENILKERKVSYQVYFTSLTENATTITRNLCNSHSNSTINLGVVGGDGTLNEVLNGIVDFEKVNMYYFPSGSGNDFARGLGITDTPVEILNAVIDRLEDPDFGGDNHIRRIDLGKITYADGSRIFGVSAGVGVDAYVCKLALTSKLKKVLNRVHLGAAVYGLLTVGAIFTMPFANARIEFDDGSVSEYGNCIFIVGMNSHTEGGGIPMCPNASMYSGVLDTFMLHDISRAKCLRLLPELVKGKHLEYDGFDFNSFSKMTVNMDIPMCVHADGEHVGFYNTVKYECLPGKLRIVSI